VILACLRAGEYDRCLQESFTGGDLLQRAIVKFSRAMAAHKLGRNDEATLSYAEGTRIIDEAFSDFKAKKLGDHMDDHWICCAMARVFQSEAKAMIHPTTD
jgi:hypothetical protein